MLFDGLASDGRLFAPQRGAFDAGTLLTPSYPPHHAGETLATYAERLSRDLLRTDVFGEGDLIGGFSFGGMAALEVARHLLRHGVRAGGVLLICACFNGRGLSALFRGPQYYGRWVPTSVVRFGVRTPLPRLFAWWQRLDRDASDLFVGMAQDVDPSFARWSAIHAARWLGFDIARDLAGVPIHAIHGDADPVIPPFRRRLPFDDQTPPPPHDVPTRWIAGGRHMLVLSHPDAVTHWLMSIRRGVSLSLDRPSPADLQSPAS